MPDLTEIVSSAVSDAKEGPANEDTTGSAGDTVESSEVAATGTGDSAEPAAAEAAPAEVAAEPEPDELRSELEALGLTVPKDNRIPYSRFKKTWERKTANLTEAHKAELKAREERLAAAEQKHQEMLRWAVQNPEENLKQLLEVNPAYKDHIKKLIEAEKGPVIPPGDPMPEPDAKFPDGTAGYSLDQQKLKDEWVMRRAEERAVKLAQANFEKQYGPLLKDIQGQKAYEAQIPALHARLERVHKTWGEDRIKANEAEITAAMKAEGQNILTPGRFEQIVTEVMLPKIAAERTKMREDILKELKAAPAAAARVAPSATSSTVDPNTPRTLEQAIKESVEAAKAAGMR